ncbi:MAG: DUF86 domain-containing protein [Arhodomonas sp.]|nr:DUF86 domain-containing protein [Arhodomonas sp.]
MDRQLIAKKLAFIETCVRELRDLARPELLETDIREARFVEHTLQLAIQAALDVASHLVSTRRLGEPQTNRALFDALHREGVIDESLADTLHAMAGFRNILVHGYQEVDTEVVRDILQNHLDDLLDYSRQIREDLH